MERDPNTLLFEIVESCRNIISFTSGVEFENYRADELIKSAVERQFIIIGEALNRLDPTDHTIFETIEHAPQIIGFRNILVHGYDVVSDELVWEIIVENVPELLRRCEEILNKRR